MPQPLLPCKNARVTACVDGPLSSNGGGSWSAVIALAALSTPTSHAGTPPARHGRCSSAHEAGCCGQRRGRRRGGLLALLGALPSPTRAALRGHGRLRAGAPARAAASSPAVAAAKVLAATIHRSSRS